MAILETKHNPKKNIELFHFTQGIDLDQRLAAQEVKVQKCWAQALNLAQFLTSDETQKVLNCLDSAKKLMDQDQFDWSELDEDIHMNLERYLTENIGELGKKIHLGRSRNDLIATTLRLFVADSCQEIIQYEKKLISSLVDRAELDIEIIIPGMTHLQNGQPIRYSHIILAHAWNHKRDIERLISAQKMCLDTMPLGSAAFNGTTIDINLALLAKNLGFNSPPLNSYDSVGDRDFMLDALNSFSQIAIHLSRLASDCILWASAGFNLVKLPKDWSTGSSIMPNKRNPDVPELVRAKAAHIISCANNAASLLRGLPSSYNSDLHELKRVYLFAIDQLTPCLQIMAPFITELVPNAAQAKKLLEHGNILATEIANELTSTGQSFRQAYAQAAELVTLADKLQVPVEKLPEKEWSKIVPQISKVFMSGLDHNYSVEQRNLSGGTSLKNIRASINVLQEFIKVPA